MNYILTDFSDEALTKANLANIVSSSPLPWNLPGTETCQEETISWCFSEIPFVPCNIAINARLRSDEADNVIAKLTEKAASYGSPLRWYVDRQSEPSDLGDRLVRHGFVTGEKPSPFMAIDLYAMNENEPAPEELEIREVKTIDEMEVWSQVATTGFGGTPENAERNFRWFSQSLEHKLPANYYLAYFNGEPAATSQLVPADGVGGLFYVATLPEFRKRGIGYQVTLRALQAARDMGYRIGTLQASSMGEPVYLRMGFHTTEHVWSYLWTKQAPGITGMLSRWV